VANLFIYNEYLFLLYYIFINTQFILFFSDFNDFVFLSTAE